MNSFFDNFIKGPLTSLMGLVLMLASGYCWFIDYLTNWEAGGAAIIGFALLFMRDKLPGFIETFFKAVLDKFSGNKTPMLIFVLSAFIGSNVLAQNDETAVKSLIDQVRATGGFTPGKVANALDALNYAKTGIKDVFTASGTDTYAATVNIAITSYTNGQTVRIKFINPNTGPSTMNWNSLGPKTILKQGVPLVAGDILSGIYELAYDGTNMQLLGDGGSGGGGGGSWGSITGTLSSQTDLQDELDGKADALITANVVTGAHTLNSTDLGIINAGGQLDVQGNNTGALTIPLNSSVAFPVGSSLSASGFTGSVIVTGGVTITGTRGDLTFPSGSSVFLQKTGTDTWTLNNGLPPGSTSVSGTTKLYTSTVTNTDGAMDQNSTKTALDAKQATLVSGTNIKTVNSTTLLGSGNLAVGDALIANPLSQFSSTTSAQLAGVISNETGTGVAVFNNSPTLITPALGTPSSATLTNATGLPVTGIASGSGSAFDQIRINTGNTAWERFTPTFNPMTTTGDIIVGGTVGIPARLAIGSTSAVLTVSGGTPVWASSISLPIVGTPSTSSAAAGIVGEEITSTVSTYTNYTTTATYQNITSIVLTAGDWDLTAFFTYNSNSATITASANAIFVVSTTTASASGSTEGKNIAYMPQAALSGTSLFSSSIAPYRVSLASTTTYYLNTQATFTAGNPQFVGTIRARRIR
jgi:hypothetical protein